MRIKMELISDVIFGNGMSVPGAEDTSVLCDEQGFPYYKGSTFKGVLREETERYLEWIGDSEAKNKIEKMFGMGGNDNKTEQIYFSDFKLSPYVKEKMITEITRMENETADIAEIIKECLTNLRTFTSISKDGVAKKGSLRIARCVNKGVSFYSDIVCEQEQEQLIKDVIKTIKWIVTKRNRGFLRLKFSIEEVSE